MSISFTLWVVRWPLVATARLSITKNTLFTSNKNKVIKFEKRMRDWHIFDANLVASFPDSPSV